MSASFSIHSASGEYQVTIASGCRPALTDACVIADRFFASQPQFLTDTLETRATIWVEAQETEKSLERAPFLIEQLRASGANRSTPLVAVGGGIIQDISAFAASVYMRGIAWSYLPTTVLSMVDSCIGGKSSINVGPYKNLVGTFHPPQQIYIDPASARTLPDDQFCSGLIEAAKICFCRGPASFSRYLACEPSPTMSPEALEDLIKESLLAKKHFIEVDEFDQKERLLLNFGHTFGHALEGASDYKLPHGIAVGLGILCSLNFQRAREVDFANAPGVGDLEQHVRQLISALPHVAKILSSIPLAEVMKRFASDKKHTSEYFTLILVASGGNVVIERHPRTPELHASIVNAIQSSIAGYLR